MQQQSIPGGAFRLAGELTVSRMGYGAMQLAGPHVFGPPADRDAAIAVLREAVALGITHIDTSDYYGPHVTNQIIKEALHPYPADLHIVTKVGARRDERGGWPHARTPAELRSAVHDNLRNLGLEVLDVVNLRVGGLDRPESGSHRRSFGALAEMRREGLIRHLGVSTVTADQVAEAQMIAPVVCVQNFYNVANREDDALIDRARCAGYRLRAVLSARRFHAAAVRCARCGRCATRRILAGYRNRVAPAAVAERAAHPGNIVDRASPRKHRRGSTDAVCRRPRRAQRNRVRRMYLAAVLITRCRYELLASYRSS